MKPINLIPLIIWGIMTFQSCKTTQKTVGGKVEPSQHLVVLQGGDKITIQENTSRIDIGKNKFSIRFYNQAYNPNNKEFYSAQIAAFLDKSELDKIMVGMLKTELSCFEPGSGMAPGKSGKYEKLIFNNSGHHYLIYENHESKRVDLIGKSGKMLELEFEVEGLYYNGREVKMKKADLDTFYLAILIDSNLNGKIEEGELHKLTVKIE